MKKKATASAAGWLAPAKVRKAAIIGRWKNGINRALPQRSSAQPETSIAPIAIAV